VVTGFDAVTCVVTRGLVAPACEADAVPARVTLQFERAGALVMAAADADGKDRQKRLRRAARRLKRALRAARRAARRGLEPGCADALVGQLRDTRGRIEAARAAAG
jgi:hypothetical protein